MPKKKKGTKKGGKKKKEASASFPADFKLPPSHIFKPKGRSWAQIHVKMITWRYLNFDLKLPTDTTLFVVCQKILAQHGGSLGKLTLWKEQVHPKNLQRDMDKTLEEVFNFDKIEVERLEAEEREKAMQRATEATLESSGGEGVGETSKEEDGDIAAPPSEGGEALKRVQEEEVGKKKQEEHVFECVIYYDFQPHETDSALILSSPRTVSKAEVVETKGGKHSAVGVV
eukprot:TRINITY_DN2913_c0_g1_i1.p2 TRINITY_DN2913_c0_g1~~TRINITY_DN2913_c0_g1_i1.p2  ORF type:complete len:228 (+),score=80.98 TRINITY_DN2913_c0_g1_i1:116-799(+)